MWILSQLEQPTEEEGIRRSRSYWIFSRTKTLLLVSIFVFSYFSPLISNLYKHRQHCNVVWQRFSVHICRRFCVRMVLFRSGLHFVPPCLNSWASVVVSPSAVTNWVEVVPLLRGHAILLHCYMLHCVQSDSALHWISTECQNFLHVLDELCVWWKISCVQKWRAPDETNFKKVCGFGLNVSRR